MVFILCTGEVCYKRTRQKKNLRHGSPEVPPDFVVVVVNHEASLHVSIGVIVQYGNKIGQIILHEAKLIWRNFCRVLNNHDDVIFVC